MNLGGQGSHILCLCLIDLGPLSTLPLLGFWNPWGRPGRALFQTPLTFTPLNLPGPPWAGPGCIPLFLDTLPQPVHFASSFLPSVRERVGSLGLRTLCVWGGAGRGRMGSVYWPERAPASSALFIGPSHPIPLQIWTQSLCSQGLWRQEHPATLAFFLFCIIANLFSLL